ncbi:TPA: hypothetical protein ACQMYM_001510 [Streptococcus pyogenes]|nr:hypothetical protein [Streptococcus pyogenes]HEQ8289422.1 hypothetical protein [Streptococcus pyogenes]HEQ8490335.1 hypothetical protein [Streptococcus pyogenes]HEQ8860120.1 hypothetical protein [Streptococcus pyogenes]HEQ9331689.1 hypothetical protein [Streptococcus pyogenes]
MQEKLLGKIINDLALKVANLTLENAQLKAQHEIELEELNAQDEATAPKEEGK